MVQEKMKALLSEIIQKVNELFDGELTEQDKLVYVNNVTDENADLAFDRERGGRARLGFHTNPPRTFGVMYRMYF